MRWMLAAVLVLLVVAPAARAEPPFRPLDSFDRLAVAGRVDHGNNGSTDTIFVTTRLSDTKSQTVALLERAHGPFLGYLDVSWSSGAASLAATEWLFQGLDKRLAIYEFPGGGLAARLDTELDTVRVPSEAHACTGNPDSACPRDVGRSRWGGTTLDPRILVPVAAAGIVSIRPDGSGASVLPNTHGTRGGIGFAPEQDLFTDGRRVSNGPAQTKPDGTTYDDLALSVPPDQLTKLTDTAFIDDHNPAFSPDGRRVAISKRAAWRSSTPTAPTRTSSPRTPRSATARRPGSRMGRGSRSSATAARSARSRRSTRSSPTGRTSCGTRPPSTSSAIPSRSRTSRPAWTGQG
jgi:WD40-like Beta Propeller Repeat